MSEFYTTIRPTDRKLWLLERDDGWGASDAAPASGQSRFKSQYRAVAEKAKLIPVEDISNDPNVRWGVKAERNLAEFMQEDHPDLVLATPQVTYHSKKWPFAFANFDGLLHYPDGHLEIWEAKTANIRTAKDWGEAEDDIPREYICQAMHGMAVLTEAPCVRFKVSIAGPDVREYVIWRDDKLIETLMDILGEAWDRVLRKDPPDPESAEDVRLRWPTDSGAERAATQAECDMVFNLKQAQELVASATKQEKYLKTQLKIGMGALSALTVGGKPVVTWRKGKDQPGYSVPPRSGSRKFLVK